MDQVIQEIKQQTADITTAQGRRAFSLKLKKGFDMDGKQLAEHAAKKFGLDLDQLSVHREDGEKYFLIEGLPGYLTYGKHYFSIGYDDPQNETQ